VNRRIAACLLAAVLCLPTVGVRAVHAQESNAAPQASADSWHFADDDTTEHVPTWREALRGQVVDLALFGAFAGLALVSFFRKSVPLKYVTMAASVAYLGVAKAQLISVVNIFGLVSWNLPIFKFNLAWYLFAGFTVVSTVLWGRLYCGRICAYGSLTQLMDQVIPAKLRFEPPTWLERRAAYVKYALLGAVVVYFLVTRDILIYRYVEPFWMFTGHATAGLWIALALLVGATVFVRNLYCRFLCPVGAFLGLLSNLTVFRIKRWSECKTCKICEKTCEWGAIRGPKIVATECVRCDDCERLYMDTNKCPHWIVLRRKNGSLVSLATAQRVPPAR
jgi:NosR/NirI family nitrous oxide reductase transcriptional regulator